MNYAKRTNRRGAVVVLVALLLVVLFAMVAFAIDIGYIVHARTELQRTSDACALAAAAQLPDQTQAALTAQNLARSNRASVGPDLDASDIEFGHWDRDTATFTVPAPDVSRTNAVRVRLRRTEEAGRPLQLFFAGVLGNTMASTQASAIAIYDHWLCGPFVGIDWVSVPGSPETDSYSSEEGAYSPYHARNRGSVCSDGPINIDGAAVIRGDARAGKGHDVTITGNATVTESIGSRLKPLNLPPVEASAAAIQNDNDQLPLIPKGNSSISPVDAHGNFLLDGNKNYDLPPGTYYFNDFTLEGQAELNISGPTIIYLAGNLIRAGGVLVNNNAQNPSHLQFLMTGGTANVTSNNAFYGVIYGPNTNITIDGAAEMFGAVVGKTLTITGTSFGHYDESLKMDRVEFPSRTALVD